MTKKTFTANDVVRIVANIEGTQLILHELLLAHMSPFDPIPETYGRLAKELRALPDLSEWTRNIPAQPQP